MHRCSTVFVVAGLVQPLSISARAASAPVWAGYGRNTQHTAQAPARPQALGRVRWTAPVDWTPQRINGELLVHYGSPMITAANTVVVPTRIDDAVGYQIVAYSGGNGALRWQTSTDYRLPPHDWTPPLPAALIPGNQLTVAAVGGTILVRSNADALSAPVSRRAFYGLNEWEAHRVIYDNAVQITTPLTAGADGALYFGFVVEGATPSHLTNGVARIDAAGKGSWIGVAAIDRSATDVAPNCAPALSMDGKTLYIALRGATKANLLVGLDTKTLAPKYKAALADPKSGLPATVSANSSAAPTIGPDGDVYFGVLENPFPENDGRGWLLHFDEKLSTRKLPGSFGWDATASVLPASALPSYRGKSSYLLVTKYNNYKGVGPHGDGHNRLALLDPNASETDPYLPVKVMKEVETVLSPQQVKGDPPGSRYEWCVNSAAVHAATATVIAHSEDGRLYRWDLRQNKLTQAIALNPPQPGAYTPTLIGPDGTAYVISGAKLRAVGSSSP